METIGYSKYFLINLVKYMQELRDPLGGAGHNYKRREFVTLLYICAQAFHVDPFFILNHASLLVGPYTF